MALTLQSIAKITYLCYNYMMNRYLDRELQDPADQIERLQLKHDICETAISVHNALRMEREPDEYFIEFHLNDEAVLNHANRLPPEVTSSLGAIESVSVEFRYTDPQARPAVVVTVQDYLKNFVYAIKHEDTTADVPFRQTLTYGDLPTSDVADIPGRAFNTFFAALIYPSKNGDFSQFEGVDMFGQRAAQSLIESMRKRFETHEEVEYRIPQLGCIVQGAGFDEELNRLTVAYSVPRTNIDASLQGPGIEADIFTSDESSSVSISKIQDISEPKGTEPVKPSSDNLTILKDVLVDILRLYQPPAQVSLDSLTEIEASGLDKKESKRISTDLSQDGLDTPDTSA